MQEVAQRLESVHVGRFHYKLLVIHGMGWLFDSMDILLLSYIIAAIISEGFAGRVAAGLIASSNNFGLFVGALTSGLMADLLGRKRVFQITLLIYSICSALSALSWDASSLSFFRFLTGFGLGGELPVVSSLLSEFIPSKHRGKFLVLLESFWAYGSLIAAVIAYLVIPNWGWRVALLIGALPAFYIWIIRRKLPESPRYLVERGRYEEALEITSQIQRYSKRDVYAPKINIGASKPIMNIGLMPNLRMIWSTLYRKRTLMLWLLWFGIVFGYYGAFIWLPGALRERGLSLVTSIYFTAIITSAQIPGYFLAAYLIDKVGRKLVLFSFLLLSSLFTVLFAYSTSSDSLILWGSLMSFFNLGAWGGVYTYTPENYPTMIRGTGSGAAAAFGRIGGIIAPTVIALVLGWAGGFTGAYLINALMFLLAALSVIILGTETKGRTLEELSR